LILKNGKTLLTMFIVLGVLSGCSDKEVSHKVVREKSHQVTKDPEPKADKTAPGEDEAARIKQDLEKYVNTLTTVSDDEMTAVKAYMSVVGSNYKDDETTYNAMVNTVIPTYEKFLNVIINYTASTDLVHQINQKYVDGANKQYQAFLDIRTALEQQDTSLIEEANHLLNDGMKEIQDFRFQLNQACEKYNVPLTFNNLD
jgi:hypothetical protein